MVFFADVLKLRQIEWSHAQTVASGDGDGLVMHVKEHIQMLANAGFDLVLHHGLLDRGQVDIQVGHQQRVGELDDRAAVCNYDGVVLASGDDGWCAFLSG
eukprot:6174390-Pleurochrysis_carterae.AAC.1